MFVFNPKDTKPILKRLGWKAIFFTIAINCLIRCQISLDMMEAHLISVTIICSHILNICVNLFSTLHNLQIFKSSYSKGFLLTTILIAVLMVNIIIGLGHQLAEVPMGSMRFYWMVFSLILFSYLVIYCFLSQIVSVNVDDERVIIQKMLGQIVISRSDILKVEMAPSSKNNVDLFAQRGPFGCIGWFYNKNMGRYFALVKNDRSKVVLRTARRCYVVSCDDREKFVALLA